MNDKEQKPLRIRILASLSSLVLIGAAIYIFFTGMELILALILIAAFGGLAGPVVASSEGLLECLMGILEAFFLGILGIFEAIAEGVSSIFG